LRFKEFGMLRIIGILLLICGLLSVVIGVFIGQSGQHVPSNILGLFDPVVAIACYGGAVVAFVGFALAVINGPRRPV
jgi:hypothetical protein